MKLEAFKKRTTGVIVAVDFIFSMGQRPAITRLHQDIMLRCRPPYSTLRHRHHYITHLPADLFFAKYPITILADTFTHLMGLCRI